MNIIYKEKYLKYKSKYNNLKKQHHGSGIDKRRILIVVDLQNCFLENFGTLGWSPEITKKEFKDDYITQYKEKITKLISSHAYDFIIFTKDSHPYGHASFKPSGPFPPHCININKSCNSETPKVTQDERDKHIIKLDEKNDLETTLIYDIKLYINEINLISKSVPITTKNIMYHIPNVKKDNNMSNLTKDQLTDIKKQKDTLIVRLNKGELCKNDAYSGFLYHVYYIDNKECDILEEKKYNNYLQHSTGLYELLDTYYQCTNNLTIDVCGLVTNICVVNTCIGGLKIFREKYMNVKINLLNEYSLNFHIGPSAIEKINKCNLEKGNDYEIIDDISHATQYNKIYFVNNKAVDDYTLKYIDT